MTFIVDFVQIIHGFDWMAEGAIHLYEIPKNSNLNFWTHQIEKVYNIVLIHT